MWRDIITIQKTRTVYCSAINDRVEQVLDYKDIETLGMALSGEAYIGGKCEGASPKCYKLKCEIADSHGDMVYSEPV